MSLDSLDTALAEWLREIVWIKIDLIFENSSVFARLVIKTTFCSAVLGSGVKLMRKFGMIAA